jgi:putative transposase
MRKTFKYRIHASKDTIAKAENWQWLCCNLYNACLQQRVDAYRHHRETISGYTQACELPLVKETFPEYKEVNSQVLQEVTERMNKAYQNFFRRVKKGGEKPGFPRFKSKSRYDSFTLKNTGWHLDGRYLWVHNVGRFKMRLSRPIEGEIKTIVIQRTATGKWYASFSCDNVPLKPLPKSDEVVGIDVGIKSFLVDSADNEPIGNPKYLKHSLKLLRIRQRKLSRAKKKSNRRKKARLQVAKLHEHIANQRRDFQHKLANEYVRKYGVIVHEKLQIKNMEQNSKLARDINDCAWGQFFEFLNCKAEEAGRIIIKVNPRNTSKGCHVCGAVNQELTLSDREWVCKNCGTVHDRDRNAAYNLRDKGLQFLKNSEARTEPSGVNVGQ